MADSYKLKIGDSNRNINYGSFTVPFPKNYTNNSAFIGQHKLTTPDSTVDSGGPNAAAWNNDNAGKLISCFEINWGNAKAGFDDGDVWDDTYTFPTTINTSADLLRYLFMLKWKLDHIDTSSKIFKITTNGLTATAETVSGTIDLSTIGWSINSSSASSHYSDIHLSASTGNTVTLQGTAGNINNSKGTVALPTISLGSNTSGSKDITATFTRTSATRLLKATVNVIAPSGTICQTNTPITLQGSSETIYGLSEATDGWKWTITGSGASKCGFGQVGTTTVEGTTKTQSLVWANTNGESITIKVSNTNGTAEVSKTLTLPVQATVYYWYVGATQPTALPSNDSELATGTDSGWRKIGTSKPSVNTILFDGMSSIDISSTKVTYYFAINSDVNIGIYDSLGNEDTQFVTGPVVSNGMNVYTTTFNGKSFNNVIKVK